jgi:hypothetical protein
MTDLANPHLNQLSKEAESVLGELATFFSKLTDAQLNWKPNEPSWSIAQCLDHVIVADQQYFTPLKKAMDEAKPAAEQKPFRASWTGRLYLRFAGPNGKIKFKAPKIFQPSNRTEGKVVLNDFAEHQRQLLALMKRANGLDLAGIKMTSPVSRFIRISLGECFSIMMAHEQRHILQAKRIYEMADFPKSSITPP